MAQRGLYSHCLAVQIYRFIMFSQQPCEGAWDGWMEDSDVLRSCKWKLGIDSISKALSFLPLLLTVR